MKAVNLFAAGNLPAWVTDSFPIIRFVLLIVIAVLSVAMVIIVMIQPSNTQGMGGLTGQADTFYSKNKSRTLEGALRRATVVIAIALFVLALLFLISLSIYAGQ